MGSPNFNAYCEPLSCNGRTLLTNTGKANAFVQKYAAANRLSFDKTQRSQARHPKKKNELERATTGVAKWSSSNKLALCADKCKVTLFSTNSHETNRQPTINATNTSLSTYTAPAWQPSAAPSRNEQLESCQNQALRMITGHLKFTPVETLRREAGICSIATTPKHATPLTYQVAASSSEKTNPICALPPAP